MKFDWVERFQVQQSHLEALRSISTLLRFFPLLANKERHQVTNLTPAQVVLRRRHAGRHRFFFSNISLGNGADFGFANFQFKVLWSTLQYDTRKD